MTPLPPTSLWQETGLLLRLRVQQARNAVRFAPRAYNLVGSLLTLGAVLLAVFLFVASNWLLGATAQVAPRLMGPLSDHTVFYLFLFLLAGGIPFVSGALLAPGDLNLLNNSPVRPAALVLARLVDAILVSSAQFVVLGGPLLIAVMQATGAGIGGWVTLPLVFGLFLSLPALILALLILLLARLIGVRRIRLAVAMASVVVSVGLCLLGISEASRRAGTSLQAFTQSLPETLPPAPLAAPSTWFSLSWHSFAGGNWAGAFGWLGVLLMFAILLVAGCVWAGVPVLTGESLLEGDSSAARFRASPFRLPLPSVLRALLEKDTRYIARDLVLLSQLGVPLILYAVPWVLMGKAGSSGQGDLFALAVGIVATVAYMETSILGLSSIGLEGRGFWHIQAAPIRMGQVIFAKWLGALTGSLLVTLPPLALSCLLFRVGIGAAGASVGVCLVTCAALSGIAVGVSGLFPRFEFDNPAHRASLAALIWGFVAATVYSLLVAVLLGGGWFLTTQQPGQSASLWRWTVAFFLALSLGAGLLPLLAARARLETYTPE